MIQKINSAKKLRKAILIFLVGTNFSYTEGRPSNTFKITSTIDVEGENGLESIQVNSTDSLIYLRDMAISEKDIDKAFQYSLELIKSTPESFLMESKVVAPFINLVKQEGLESKNDSQRIGVLYSKLGSRFLSFNLDSSQKFLNEGMHFALSAGDTNQVIINCINLAVAYNQMNKFHKQSEVLYQGLRLAELNLDSLKLSFLHNSLANMYLGLEKKEKAKLHGLQSLRYLSGNRDKRIGVFGVLSVTYRLYQDLDSALFYGDLNLDLYKDGLRPDKLSLAYSAIGEIYLEKENYKQASKYFDSTLLVANKYGIQRFPQTIYNHAYCLEKSENYSRALLMFQMAIDAAHKEGDMTSQELGYFHKSQNYRALGQFEKAYESMKLAYEYRDSSIQMEKVREVEEIAEKYEVEKKELKIANVEAINRQQAILIDKEKLYKRIFLVLGISLFVIGTVVTWYIMKKRAELSKKEFSEKLNSMNMDLLLNRLHPHFVYNGLNTVQGLVLNKDFEAASKYIEQFSLLLRGFLESMSVKSIPVEEEIRLIERYCSLEQLNRKVNFDFRVSIEEGLDLKGLFPSMILQPLVENAIKHGLPKDQNEQGVIELSISRDSGHWVCMIKDNGDGLKTDESRIHQSRGMEIIKKRIDLLGKLHGKKFSISLKNRENHPGAITTFTAPILA